ncbi:MAG TPA: response regulator [Calditrichia bacterium]|nr:response regulator [Calditrichota bacterium]HQU72343.1 response regulator [Calditrichia bacterium]HQV31884.1 response regulator [Calditrichia bacterium]
MEDKTVLFVEDSPTMRRIISNSLSRIGFNKVIESENGVDALAKAEGEDIGLILTDWNMPEMNGYELVENLRSQDKFKDTPIIMITTRGMQDDVMNAIKIGVNGYIVKPFTPKVLEKKIKEVVS